VSGGGTVHQESLAIKSMAARGPELATGGTKAGCL
jgi:hypothetical protein